MLSINTFSFSRKRDYFYTKLFVLISSIKKTIVIVNFSTIITVFAINYFFKFLLVFFLYCVPPTDLIFYNYFDTFYSNIYIFLLLCINLYNLPLSFNVLLLYSCCSYFLFLYFYFIQLYLFL